MKPNREGLASRLRHRITLETPVMTDDGGGGKTISWNKFADAWAELITDRPTEKLLGEQLVATATYRVTIRYLKNVAHYMRVKFSNRIFSIKSVWNENEEKRVTKMIIEEDLFQ